MLLGKRNPWLVAAGLLTALPLFAEPRTIVINEDRAQHFMTSKTYELKYTEAHNLMPFILGAVKRFDAQSTVQSLDYAAGGKQYLLVSTASALFPYIDEMIATLDYPAKKVDENGSVIEGDGIYRWVYCPDYRSTAEMNEVIAQTFTGGYGSGASYFDAATNMFYFKSSRSEGEAYLRFLKVLDRPVPQVTLELNVYAVSDDYFRELGIDYLSWKNGPGAKLFNVGWSFNDNSISNLGDLNFAEIFATGSESLLGPAGGFLVAPNLDATFLRMLAQRGKAWTAAAGSLTLINDPAAAADNFDDAVYRFKYVPQLQNLVKDEDQSTTVEAFDTTEYSFFVSSPILCFGDAADPGAVTVMGSWNLTINSLAEVNNLGVAAVNSDSFGSALTLACGTEKLVAGYRKSVKTKQWNGVPFLGEIPVLKYLFGAESEVDSKYHIFVTMSARTVMAGNPPPPVAGELINTILAAN